VGQQGAASPKDTRFSKTDLDGGKGKQRRAKSMVEYKGKDKGKFPGDDTGKAETVAWERPGGQGCGEEKGKGKSKGKEAGKEAGKQGQGQLGQEQGWGEGTDHYAKWR
jgi:hypothetical protein